VQLVGSRGLPTGLTKSALDAEMSQHPVYDKNDRGRGSRISGGSMASKDRVVV
jgi:hypothetical protein